MEELEGKDHNNNQDEYQWRDKTLELLIRTFKNHCKDSDIADYLT